MLVLEVGLGKVAARGSEPIFLLPGQWHFGAHGAQVRTLLGSCVALALWHPQRHQGGMCHFLLPDRARAPTQQRDGRFGDEAMEMLADAMARSGTRSAEYEVHLYGGADTMPGSAALKFNIGARNIEKALELIDQYDMQLQTVDVGGNEPRNVLLDLSSGQVQLRRGKPHEAPLHQGELRKPRSATLSHPPIGNGPGNRAGSLAAHAAITAAATTAAAASAANAAYTAASSLSTRASLAPVKPGQPMPGQVPLTTLKRVPVSLERPANPAKASPTPVAKPVLKRQ